MELLFLLSLFFLAYTFAGYPLLLWTLSCFRRRSHRRATIWPTISVIIAVRNQPELLLRKLTNTLTLVYPEGKREIIVASDASDDATVEVARSYRADGVKLVESPQWQGKHYVQMLARDASCGEILVFTDVSVHLETDALERIVSNFADPSVGCVSSVDAIATQKRSWTGEALYVQFDTWLRRLEARVGSLVGNSGSFFAARRVVCEKWHPEQSSDFFLALHAVARGLRSVVDPECRGHYRLVRSERAEFGRKVRTIVHGLNVLFNHLELLNPIRYGFFSWQLLSHKLFRWLVPFAFFSLLVSNLMLRELGGLYQLCAILQLGVYGSGFCALAGGRLLQVQPFKIAGFFVLGNAATAMAWLYFVWGERFVTWQASRREESA